MSESAEVVGVGVMKMFYLYELRLYEPEDLLQKFLGHLKFIRRQNNLLSVRSEYL